MNDPMDSETLLPPPDIQYEDRVVAYLDVLGWSDLMKGSGHPERLAELTWPMRELERRATVWARLRRAPESAGVAPDVSHFSDSIVISMKFTNQAALATWVVIHEVRRISSTLLFHAGALVRGAVVRGPMFHSGSVAFGPALVEAVTLEKYVAFYPRIIIADELVHNSIAPIHNSALPDVNYSQALRDHDGLEFLDVMKPSLPGPDPEQAEFRSFLVGVRERIRDGYSEAKGQAKCSPRKQPKWGWLVGYFNNVVAENPAFQLEPLVF